VPSFMSSLSSLPVACRSAPSGGAPAPERIVTIVVLSIAPMIFPLEEEAGTTPASRRSVILIPRRIVIVRVVVGIAADDPMKRNGCRHEDEDRSRADSSRRRTAV